MLDPETLKELTPIAKPTIMELVHEAGLNVEDWGNYQRGPTYASTNPKYCYEWAFEQGELTILNIWLENMRQDSVGVFQRLNVLKDTRNSTGLRKQRAQRFFQALQNAYSDGRHVRSVILDRPTFGTGKAITRRLDDAPWMVTNCKSNGDFEIRRNFNSALSHVPLDAEALGFQEGQLRERFIKERHRENKLRDAKILEAKRHMGKLVCQVPGCEFDFEAKYGPVGKDFAEVHHLDQLSQAPVEGQKTSLDRLIVVCANCHRMIHRHGKCRDHQTLIRDTDVH